MPLVFDIFACCSKNSNIQEIRSIRSCELLRPAVLFGDPAIQRAKETDEPRTSLERKADVFDTRA